MDQTELAKAIGRIEANIKDVKAQTAKIPEIAVGLALVKQDMETIKPKVARHEKVMWVGSGVWAAILLWFEAHK